MFRRKPPSARGGEIAKKEIKKYIKINSGLIFTCTGTITKAVHMFTPRQQETTIINELPMHCSVWLLVPENIEPAYD